MDAVTRRHWRPRQQGAEFERISAELAKALSVDKVISRLLVLRGITSAEQGDNFLHSRLSALPDPSLLPDLDIACQRIFQALQNSEAIAVHGDYDVDGISGCTVLVEGLRLCGADVSYHIPLRLRDGYGLSADALRREADDGCRLVVTVDCGVSAIAEADLAAQLGLDLIITDHHQPPPQLPTCLALINPHLTQSNFPWPDLAGVGVAFFLLLGLRRYLRQQGWFNDRQEPDLRQLLDLVALGTIADIVPLGGVNRILVRTGLELLEMGNRPGVEALKQAAEVKQVSCGSVGFRLAPRLNAAGRLEDAATGVEMLLSDDIEFCRTSASALEAFNRERQGIERKTFDQAVAMLNEMEDNFSIVLASDQWHSGVIGIVASRLVERYHRPTVLIAVDPEGKGKGSARSIRGFHLYDAFQVCCDDLLGFGGHAMAAGLTIDSECIDRFRDSFEAHVRSQLTNDDLIPVLQHDGEVDLALLTPELLSQIEQLNPFGAGNPQPSFVSRSCRVFSPRILADKHLKFSVEQHGHRIDCIAFGQAEKYGDLSQEIDLLFKPGLNTWRGKTSVQLQVSDFVSTKRL